MKILNLASKTLVYVGLSCMAMVAIYVVYNDSAPVVRHIVGDNLLLFLKNHIAALVFFAGALLATIGVLGVLAYEHHGGGK